VRRRFWLFCQYALIVIVASLCGMCVDRALACTGYLIGEQVVTVNKNGYVRTYRLCYYDHLGEPFMTTVPSHSFCRTTINVPHPGEDRDGDGEDDGEER
jgi:hypothetical protein